MNTIDVVFDGPPNHEAGRFVEVEDAHGTSINAGEWVEREDGFWALRIKLDTQMNPLLGLATTKHLLEELATRMEITQNSTNGRELGSMCRQAIANLSPGVLHYRTVD
jgi:hypothetical protein